MTLQSIDEHIQELSTDQKLDLLYRLWDEVAQELQTRPATEAERRFLEDRLRDIEMDPRGSRDWEEARDDLLAGR
jgi:putative addiction module component (TIGR02574 family)